MIPSTAPRTVGTRFESAPLPKSGLSIDWDSVPPRPARAPESMAHLAAERLAAQPFSGAYRAPPPSVVRHTQRTDASRAWMLKAVVLVLVATGLMAAVRAFLHG